MNKPWFYISPKDINALKVAYRGHWETSGRKANFVPTQFPASHAVVLFHPIVSRAQPS